MSATNEMSRVKMLTVAAVCIALAFALNQVAIFRMPMGGSVTPASMLFIVLAGYWLGPVYGIMSGVAMGLLDTAMGAYIVHPLQYVFDYILGFGALGIAGFFRKWKFGLQIGYIAGVLGRFVMVFLSGWFFFYMFAPEGQHAAVYSAIYNMSYILPEMIATFVIISLPAMRHAIDTVTRSVVPAETYAQITKSGSFIESVTETARLASGAVFAALGGIAFVISGHIQRIEYFAVQQYITGAELFYEAPRRIPRMLERNSEQILALNIVGVLFLAIGAALLFSVLFTSYSSKQNRQE